MEYPAGAHGKKVAHTVMALVSEGEKSSTHSVASCVF